MALPSMRSGVVGDTNMSEAEIEVLDNVAALMRLFTKDSLTVAGRYAHANGRRSVTGHDMRAALMYCARTFFEKGDSELETLVKEEREEMAEEDSDENDSEESDGEESEHDNEDHFGSTPASETEENTSIPIEPSDMALAKHVDAIVAVWDHWQPIDPVHCLIKRAIDHTTT
jgi:Mg-chelatase subunit ChlI